MHISFWSALEELFQHRQYFLLMLTHTDLPSNIVLSDRLLVQVVVVKEPPIGDVLDDSQVMGVTFVVTNVKLVRVHKHLTNSTPRGNQRQAEV
jgi:hypothetical protein